jgi:bifunctional UDP-N-acetylglucosamine pyrophosphorylase/glucosamine-1-phosphate N-acetyltransferase
MLAVVVLAAGKGTRMRSEMPKVLHALLGAPLLEYAFDKSDGLDGDRAVAVIGWGRDQIQKHFEGRDVLWAVQEEQLGTAHAAHVGIEALFAELAADSGLSEDSGKGKDVDVLVLNGDLPLLGDETLARLIRQHRDEGASVTVLTCEKDVPTGYGRIVRAPNGQLTGIVEEADCDEATRALCEVNVGTYVFRGADFRKYYERIDTDNKQGELYLTDVVVEAAKDGARVEAVSVLDELETAQVNSQKELAAASAILREWIVDELLDSGVRVDDPANTYIERGVEIAPGAHIHPFCVIRRGVRIGAGCEVGPFAHLRPGSDLRAGAKVGNFCEVKNSILREASKTSHLSYIGDGDVGARVNIGAGTIFANYDGKNKHRIVVKEQAFIGSGTVLVAPVTIGERAQTGAGSVVLRGRDVEDDGVVVGVPARKLGGGPAEGAATEAAKEEATVNEGPGSAKR